MWLNHENFNWISVFEKTQKSNTQKMSQRRGRRHLTRTGKGWLAHMSTHKIRIQATWESAHIFNVRSVPYRTIRCFSNRELTESSSKMLWLNFAPLSILLGLESILGFREDGLIVLTSSSLPLINAVSLDLYISEVCHCSDVHRWYIQRIGTWKDKLSVWLNPRTEGTHIIDTI